jgi:peptide/nickel transport system substrate-binding protein
VYATIGEPYCLDPAVENVGEGVGLLLNIYETLVWYDGPRTDVLIPVLATEVPSVENGLISSDGLAYTLHVTPGVTFHDGTMLTAEDVVYSIQRVLRIHSTGGPSWMLEQVLTDYVSYFLGSTVADYTAASNNAPWITALLEPLGADHTITEADVQAVSEASVVKADDMTVIFRLTHAFPAFVSELASGACSIVSRDYVEAHGGVVNGEESAWMNMHTCGTGPYEFVTWDLGVSISLKRFAGYHGTPPSLVDVTVAYVNDVNTRLMMLEDGTADSIYLPSSYEYMVAGNPDVMVIKGYPTFDMDFAAFNFHIDSTSLNSTYGGTITDDFFTDLHMRKAFAHLVDYANLIQQRNGNAMQSNGPIPKGMLGYDPTVPVYTYDLAVAQAELELAKNPATGNSWWVDGFAIPLFFNAGNIYRQAFCEGMKTALESLGTQFTIIVVPLDWPTYVHWIFSSPSIMPMLVGGWGPDYADPDDYATPLLDSTYGYYMTFSGYANPAIDALVREAAAELDPAIRISLYSQLSWLAHDDVPYLWLTQALSFQVMRSWVAGYYYNPMHYGLYYPALSKVAPAGIEVVKNAGSPAHSAVTWEYVPMHYGNWTGRIVNNGLRSLVVDVYDITTGVPDEIMHQRINFRAEDAYPAGTVITHSVIMSPSHKYQITVTPNGPRDSSAVVTSTFKAARPPVASFTCMTDHLLVSVDGSSSFDIDGTVVAWTWDWGDGSTGDGVMTSHTYETAGTYTVTLLVTDDDGLSNTKGELVSVVVAPAKLSPPHSDYGLDTDSDGLYDYLVVDVSVFVSTAGYYDIGAWLHDGSYNWIDEGGYYTYLDSGLQTIEVSFRGYVICSSDYDGPYYALLELFDEQFNFLETDTYTTQAYTRDQFQTPPAELAPPHGDHGLDADGDGMFDYLVIDVSVSVSLAGFYNFDCADLYDSSWHWISWADNRTYLDPGLQTVQILFEGDLMYTSGFSGPYCVGLDLCDSGGTELDSETYVTQTYTWNQFDPP